MRAHFKQMRTVRLAASHPGFDHWENPLTGCGYGIATLAAAPGSAGNLAAIEHKRRQDAAAANAATSANAAST